MLQVPFVVLQLGLRPARRDGLQHAIVGVADDAIRRAGQGGEERAPVGRLRAREGHRAPEPRPAGPVADSAQDIEGDPAAGDPSAALVQGPDPEGQMIEQERARGRPGARAVRLIDDRCERLDLVGDELPVARFTQLAGLCMKEDPRFTRTGGWLRRWSFDELPQIINVMKGEMSLVGPRPLWVEEAKECRGWTQKRLDITPGITGLWQVLGRTGA